MIRQSFYQLPRITQDRFIAATAGHCPPEPLLISSVPSERAPTYWLVASGVAALATICALRLGYGELTSSLALAPHYMWGVYSLLITITLWAAFMAFSARKTSATVPYRRARYVFPSAMIDTSESDFRVYPLSELVSVESQGPSVILVFPGGVRARFEAANADRAQSTREAVTSAKRALLELEIEGGDRARLDPLLEPRYTNPLSSRKPLAGPGASVPLWTLPVAGLLGLLLAAGIFSVRNTLSERRLFARAVAANSPDALRAYLARGGKRAEVNNVLLPRAELLQLTQQGDLAALESYAANNPDSSIRPEIEAALRTQLLAALATSAAEKTLGALDAFQAQHTATLPLVRTEWSAARKALVSEAFERFAPRAAETADLIPFMKAVLAHVAEHGPLFEVRFQRVIPESSVRADELVRQDKYFRESLVPSQYFVESRIEPWFEKIFQRVFRGFGLSFQTDILNVKRGAPLPGGELPDSLPVPTLAVSYSTNMGRGISNRNPGGMFFGVGFQFKARLIVAGRPPLELRYSTWKPPDLLKLREDKITVSEVYDGMTSDAFKALEGRVGNWLFKRER